MDGCILPRIHKRIPVQQIHNRLRKLLCTKLELGEDPTRPQIMLVFVDLSQGITNLKVRLVVVHPVAFAAVHRNTTIRAFEVHMSRC